MKPELTIAVRLAAGRAAQSTLDIFNLDSPGGIIEQVEAAKRHLDHIENLLKEAK